jgi:type II secretory pathway component PulM
MQANSIIAKLRHRLHDWRRLLEKLPPERQRLVWLLGGGLALLLLYLVVVNPLLDLEESWSQELAQRSQVLAKYQALVASKVRVAEANRAIKSALASTETQFLDGSNPAVAASNLQEIIKTLAQDRGVQLTSTKVLPTREAGHYLEVPVQIQFSGSINQVLDIVYYLEHHRKLLFIPEIEINAPRNFKGEDSGSLLQISLVVSGVTKKGLPS